MQSEMTVRKFAFQKVDDVAMGAIGGCLGTAAWQTFEDTQRSGKLTAPDIRKLSGKAIFTLPFAMTLSLVTNYRDFENQNQNRSF